MTLRTTTQLQLSSIIRRPFKSGYLDGLQNQRTYGIPKEVLFSYLLGLNKGFNERLQIRHHLGLTGDNQ